MSTTHSKLAPIAICLAFGLAACADDNKSTADETTAPVDAGDGGGYDFPPTPTVVDTTVGSETSATDASDTSVDDSGGEIDVTLADSSLGEIMVDGDGMTLYLFANDPPDTATCTGDCAITWPPLLADGDLNVGDGLDDSLFVTVDGEGGQQVSYFGRPLYYYAGDSAPGDVNGNGVGNVWFAIGADGDPVT